MRRMVLLVAVVLGSLACVGAEAPAAPSWDEDVYRVLRGNCSHCHGQTAGPGTNPASRYDICSSAPFNAFFSAEKLWILGADAMGNPILGGASVFAGVIAAQTGPGAMEILRMPPAPASPLDDYEASVLDSMGDGQRGQLHQEAPNRKPGYTVIKAPAVEMGKVVVTIQVGDPDGDQVFGYVSSAPPTCRSFRARAAAVRVRGRPGQRPPGAQAARRLRRRPVARRQGEPVASLGDPGRPADRHPPPPEAWPAVRAAARRLLFPVERFLAIEAASGVLLLIAAAARPGLGELALGAAATTRSGTRRSGFASGRWRSSATCTSGSTTG